MIKLAYAYEQATQHRRPPASTPPLWAQTGGAWCMDSSARRSADHRRGPRGDAPAVMEPRALNLSAVCRSNT